MPVDTAREKQDTPAMHDSCPGRRYAAGYCADACEEKRAGIDGGGGEACWRQRGIKGRHSQLELEGENDDGAHRTAQRCAPPPEQGRHLEAAHIPVRSLHYLDGPVWQILRSIFCLC